MAIPALIVFDLDACLWSPEMYELDNAPSTYDAKRGGVKAGRDTVKLFPGAQATLLRLLTEPCFQNCKVAAASSTTEPDFAQTCLEQMQIDPSGERTEVVSDLIKFKQIYPGSKGRDHFPRLQKETGIPYSEMIFFDDCTYSDNCREVATSCPGVTCVRTPRGLTTEEFNIAIKAFAEGQKGVIQFLRCYKGQKGGVQR
jgi:magnesium-dependent phosphatase 1